MNQFYKFFPFPAQLHLTLMFDGLSGSVGLFLDFNFQKLSQKHAKFYYLINLLFSYYFSGLQVWLLGVVQLLVMSNYQNQDKKIRKGLLG